MKAYAVSWETPQTIEDLEKILKSIGRIEKESIVLFPEYFIDKGEHEGVRMNDEKIECLKEYAKSIESFIATGMIEKDNEDKRDEGLVHFLSISLMNSQAFF